MISQCIRTNLRRILSRGKFHFSKFLKTPTHRCNVIKGCDFSKNRSFFPNDLHRHNKIHHMRYFSIRIPTCYKHSFYTPLSVFMTRFLIKRCFSIKSQNSFSFSKNSHNFYPKKPKYEGMMSLGEELESEILVKHPKKKFFSDARKIEGVFSSIYIPDKDINFTIKWLHEKKGLMAESTHVFSPNERNNETRFFYISLFLQVNDKGQLMEGKWVCVVEIEGVVEGTTEFEVENRRGKGYVGEDFCKQGILDPVESFNSHAKGLVFVYHFKTPLDNKNGKGNDIARSELWYHDEEYNKSHLIVSKALKGDNDTFHSLYGNFVRKEGRRWKSGKYSFKLFLFDKDGNDTEMVFEKEFTVKKSVTELFLGDIDERSFNKIVKERKRYVMNDDLVIKGYFVCKEFESIPKNIPVCVKWYGPYKTKSDIEGGWGPGGWWPVDDVEPFLEKDFYYDGSEEKYNEISFQFTENELKMDSEFKGGYFCVRAFVDGDIKDEKVIYIRQKI